MGELDGGAGDGYNKSRHLALHDQRREGTIQRIQSIMHNLSSTARSDHCSSPSGTIGYFTEISERQGFGQDIIEQANSVSLIRIFHHYNIQLNEQHYSTICPFKFHKDGHEHSPSFYYYHDTNSFFCFGCKTGGKFAHGCHFVATIEDINKYQAAQKIVTLFGNDIDEHYESQEYNSSERLEIMMKFSNYVLKFRQNYVSEHAFQFIEYICSVFDASNLLHKHTNEALQDLTDELIGVIDIYSSDLVLSF